VMCFVFAAGNDVVDFAMTNNVFVDCARRCGVFLEFVKEGNVLVECEMMRNVAVGRDWGRFLANGSFVLVDYDWS